MFPVADAEKPCFGPAEIHVMRRALELAEGALVARPAPGRRVLQERRQRLAKSIISLATQGELDPVVLSAAALGSEPPGAVAAPTGRRPRRQTTRR